MVQTRSQLENLSKEELNEELIAAYDILSNRFDDFLRRFEVPSSDLVKSRFKHFRGFHGFVLHYEFEKLEKGCFSYLSEKNFYKQGLILWTEIIMRD